MPLAAQQYPHQNRHFLSIGGGGYPGGGPPPMLMNSGLMSPPAGGAFMMSPTANSNSIGGPQMHPGMA